MKELLGFINGSQDTSNVASNNKDTHKVCNYNYYNLYDIRNIKYKMFYITIITNLKFNYCIYVELIQERKESTLFDYKIFQGQHANNQHLSEITSDVNPSQEMASQECTEIPRPSYSYRSNHASSSVHEHKTAHYVNSPGSPSLFEARNPMYRRKSSDSDEAFEKQFESTNSTHSTNRFLSLRSANVPRECQNAADRKTAQDTQGEFVQRLERWRLNPLDVCINENDVPLQQPNRSSAEERVPFRYCKEMHTSEQRDQIIRFVSQHLKEIADLWCSWNPAANSIFQWGSPIQVGTTLQSLPYRSYR